ncbi:MAG: DNA polymerase IV [Planctomycetes bacterium]|nr:DNA polymerase IV [Planctomycetota bacterium]
MSSCILHVDIDAFFASVEQLRNPRLRGVPVAVGSGVVASASYEARRFGITAGMPLRKAREICPALTVIEGHAPIYRCFSERIFAICAEYAPAIEAYLDEAYCDWNGTERLYPDPTAVASEIRRRVRKETGLAVSAGIGRNRMFAKMSTKSAKPDGLRRLLPSEEEAFIRDLPASRLPGVGPRTERLLEKLNVRTVGEMRLLSRESLRAMLGLPGLLLYDRCRGEDTRAISRREVPRSIQRETSFHEPAIALDVIEGTLYYLTERASSTLRRLGLVAHQLGVKIRYADRVEESAVRKLPAPTQLDQGLFAFAVRLLRSLFVRRAALQLVGVVLSGLGLDSGLRQLSLLEGVGSTAGLRREARLLESLDTIRERYGHASVVRGKSLHLLGKLEQDDHGFILRTPCLTK